MLVTGLALLIAIIIPGFVLWFIFKRNVYQTGSPWLIIGAFGWGIAAYFIAALINKMVLLNNGLVDVLTLVKFITPWQEEILKALILIFFIRNINFTYFVDGAILGFAIGIGFAIAENFEYVLAFQNAALGVAVSRVISTNLMHASATALTGIAFGIARFYPGLKKIGVIFCGLAAAILLHFGFNNLVNTVSSSLLLLYAAGTGIIATGIIYLVIRKGIQLARKWIDEKLGMADRVTKSESKLAQQVGSSKTMLDPLDDMFGKGKAKQVKEFLYIQARLGIHRENLAKFQDPKMIEATQSEIKALKQQMDQMRKAQGTYVMTMLRSLFPESDVRLWEHLTATIEERMKSPSPTRSGLWDSLDKKIVQK